MQGKGQICFIIVQTCATFQLFFSPSQQKKPFSRDFDKN